MIDVSCDRICLQETEARQNYRNGITETEALIASVFFEIYKKIFKILILLFSKIS